MKKVCSVLLAAVLLVSLLAACGGEPQPTEEPTETQTELQTEAQTEVQTDPTEGSALVEYHHSIGVSLSMEEGFVESSAEGVLGCYEGELSNVRFAEELFVNLESLGYDPEMSLEEYAWLILGAYQLEGEPMTDDYGNVYIVYTQDIQGYDVTYYAYFTRGEVAFWMTTFMCFAEIAPDMEADFALWASTIQVPDTAVTEPIA